jgi:hypothetical protein
MREKLSGRGMQVHAFVETVPKPASAACPTRLDRTD